MNNTYTAKEIEIANKTSRSSGAVGKNAIIPRMVKDYLQDLAENNQDIYKVLDFGAGKDAVHAQNLNENSFCHVDAYEFGKNSNDNHIKGLVFDFYDIVYASNVLNVQSSITMLIETLTTIHSCLRKGGKFIANYPKSPRKMPDYTREQMLYMIEGMGFQVEFNKKYLTYFCTKVGNKTISKQKEV